LQDAGHVSRSGEVRLHLDHVAERIVKNFENPGWRKHGNKTCGVTAEMGDLDRRVERHRLIASPLIRLHAAVQAPHLQV
jgi:hypothetical protein